ncbi:MAG: DUF5106 domain-containing protein, partial [Bacteroidaceae bacterium]
VMKIKEKVRYIIVLMVFAISPCSIFGQIQGEPIPQSSQEVYLLPSVPDLLQTVQDRAEYVLSHYWDGYNFSPISVQQFQSVSEQCMVNYLDLLSHFPDLEKESIHNFIVKLRNHDPMIYEFYMNLLESYLYNPNSPMRNESVYIFFLEDFTRYDKISKIEKQRYIFQLKLAMRNCPGHKATNFTYTLADGTRHTLYDLKAQYTLLYINNPDCHDCQRVSRAFSQQPFSSLFENGKVTLLSVFPDLELYIWKDALKNNYFPSSWIVAYDADTYIVENNIYDLRAVSTMYLLDKKKQVILKDARLSEIESYLRLKSII